MDSYKEHTAISNESNHSRTVYMGDAKKMANIVATELDNENYSAMNVQLSEIAASNTEKDTWVFEHPGVVSRYFALVLIVTLSISFLYFLFIGIATYCFSSTTEVFVVGMILICVSAIVLLANAALIARLVSTIKFKTRFDSYEELLGYKSWEFIEDIAICAKQKEAVVIKDLHRAIKQKLIPQGHFSNENRVFMVSNQAFNQYMENPAVYDRYFQKKIEERRRVKARTRKISQMIETGEQYIEKIHGYSTLVKDKRVSRKISKMKAVVSMIFHELDANPGQAPSLGVFLNYYLPTTEKLLDAYVTMDEKQVSGKKTSQMRKEIDEALNTILEAFENILEKMYEDQEMDIISDIEAMELSMKQECLTT